MKTIAILGARGMLGQDVAAAAARAGYHVHCYDHHHGDITDAVALAQIVENNDVVVNCAAFTAVDLAESKFEQSQRINAVGPGILGCLAAAAGKYVLHISTDFVFGENGGQPLCESDPVNPLNVYGRSKYLGERLLTQSGCRCGIIRVAWTYGRYGNNFISKILELAARLPELKVVDDQVGSPTATANVARAMLPFLEREITGLYHYTDRGYASRYEVACFIASCRNLEVKITPCASAEFNTPARRPLNSRFDCSKIDTVLDFQRPDWHEEVRRFLA